MSTVGLLFVHGIGMQQRGTILAQYGDPFLQWATKWAEAQGGRLRIESPTVLEGDPPEAEAVLILPGRDPVQLIITESCWAQSFNPPSIFRVIWWVPRITYRILGRTGVIATLLMLMVFSVAASLLVGMGFRGALFLAGAFVLALITPLIVLLVILLARVLPSTRGMANAVTSWLVSAGGDAYMLTRSPTAFSAMRATVVRDLTRLMGRVDRVVVVAHSQGSVVTISALADRPDLRVDRLITVGSAVHLLDHRAFDTMGRFRDSHPNLIWQNIYCAWDPVCAGPIDLKSTFPVDIRVALTGMPWGAHTSYPNDIETVQMIILASVAESTGSFWEVQVAERVRRALVLRDSRNRTYFTSVVLSTLAAILLGFMVLDLDTTGNLATKLLSQELLPVPDAMRGLRPAIAAGVLSSLAALLALMFTWALLLEPTNRIWNRRWADRLAEGSLSPRLDLFGMLTTATLLPLAAAIAGLATSNGGMDLMWWGWLLAILALHGIVAVRGPRTIAPHDQALAQALRRRPNSMMNVAHLRADFLSLPDGAGQRFATHFGTLFHAYRDKISGVQSYTSKLWSDGLTSIRAAADVAFLGEFPKAVEERLTEYRVDDSTIVAVRVVHDHGESSDEVQLVGSDAWPQVTERYPNHFLIAVCQDPWCVTRPLDLTLEWHLVEGKELLLSKPDGVFTRGLAPWADVKKMSAGPRPLSEIAQSLLSST